MTEQQPRPHVRITRPEEVLSIISLMFSFQPSQADLLMLGLGVRGQLTVTTRIDAADHLLRAVRRHLRTAITPLCHSSESASTPPLTAPSSLSYGCA
jgi:hypothetical protein